MHRKEFALTEYKKSFKDFDKEISIVHHGTINCDGATFDIVAVRLSDTNPEVLTWYINDANKETIPYFIDYLKRKFILEEFEDETYIWNIPFNEVVFEVTFTKSGRNEIKIDSYVIWGKHFKE